jgi:general secretion pathway protein F
MPAFRYRAVGATGDILRGEMEAGSASDVALSLQKRGLTVLKIDPARGGRSGFTLDIGGASRLRGPEVIDMTRELATMLGAGQDIDRALKFMVDGASNKRVAGILGRLRDRVRDGAALAAALQQEKRSFSKLYIGLIRAGEAGGDLAATLERLSTLLERQRSLTATIQSAMIYPAILVVAAIGSIMLLLTQVLPQFVPLFVENGVALPASTAFLLGLGQAVSAYGVFALIAMVALGFGLRTLLRRPAPRLAVDGWLLRLPIAGGLLRDVLAARFTRTLGSLLINGVPLLAALTVVQEAIGNLTAQAAVQQAADGAKGGQGIARSLQSSAVFPARMVQLLRLGEDTAQLGAMALRAADIHEERARLGVQRVVALLVPAITILMGAAVAGIVSSLLLAMLSLNDIAQ